jgi:hypothetical protein
MTIEDMAVGGVFLALIGSAMVGNLSKEERRQASKEAALGLIGVCFWGFCAYAAVKIVIKFVAW